MISIPSILYYSLAIMTTGMVGDDDNGDDGGDGSAGDYMGWFGYNF